eukprot:2559214-Rhodomonas_salina.1
MLTTILCALIAASHHPQLHHAQHSISASSLDFSLVLCDAGDGVQLSAHLPSLPRGQTLSARP